LNGVRPVSFGRRKTTGCICLDIVDGISHLTIVHAIHKKECTRRIPHKTYSLMPGDPGAMSFLHRDLQARVEEQMTIRYMSFYYDENEDQRKNFRDLCCLKHYGGGGYRCSLPKNHPGKCVGYAGHNLLDEDGRRETGEGD
jgi:hypothetical protein